VENVPICPHVEEPRIIQLRGGQVARWRPEEVPAPVSPPLRDERDSRRDVKRWNETATIVVFQSFHHKYLVTTHALGAG
jgi:hypothetical protein